MRIDKSKFSPEELAQYTALVAKAAMLDSEPDGTPEPAQKSAACSSASKPKKAESETQDLETAKKANTEDESNLGSGQEPAQKSDIPSELASALARMEQLEKSIELKNLEELAKKYEPMGEKPSELATTLYGLKKSNTASYDAYLKLLDKNLELFEKSGLFGEIGKSGNRGEGGSVIEKIHAAAAEIQKADPGMSHTMAVAKAWEAHPELVQEYDAEYSGQ